MSDTQTIGDKEWAVGQHVRWASPSGQSVIREIVKFTISPRNGEPFAIMDNGIGFSHVDVERGWVKECRNG